MPFTGSMGYSDNTPLKQDHFAKLLRTHMTAVKSIITRGSWADPWYLYVDLNAGWGRYCIQGQVIFGSPIIAVTTAKAFGVPLQAIVYERDVDAVHCLKQELRTLGMTAEVDYPDIFHDQRAITMTLCAEDYLVEAPELLGRLQRSNASKRYGLIYSDESGNIPPFALLAAYAKTLPKFDILIHLAATTIKRVALSPRHTLTQRLDALLHVIPKKYWIIRRPYGHHQWTFLIGTNWDAFPDFRRQHFWPIESPEGANILRQLSFSTKERDRHVQQNLFEGEIW